MLSVQLVNVAISVSIGLGRFGCLIDDASLALTLITGGIYASSIAWAALTFGGG